MKKLNEKYISSFDFHTHIFMYQLSQRLGQHTKSSLEKLDRNILGRQISKTKYLLLNRKEKKNVFINWIRDTCPRVLDTYCVSNVSSDTGH